MVLGLGSRKQRRDEGDAVVVPLPILVAGTYYIQVAPLNEFGQWVGADANNHYVLFEGADKWVLSSDPRGLFAEIVDVLP